MKTERKVVLNEKGQSAVEYILLMSVIMLFVTSVFKSDLFQDLLGPEGKLFTEYAKVIEYSYSHALPPKGNINPDNLSNPHDSYYSREEGDTRFFTLVSKYPE